jgi:hypothetical protein
MAGVKRLLLALVIAPALAVVLAAGGAGSHATTSIPPDGEPITTVTLADERNLSECISALPRPGCRTSNRSDGMQLAVLGVMAGGIAIIAWRITRSIRIRDRSTP